MRAVAWVGRNVWIAVLALVVGIVTPALARERYGERESLAGLGGVYVVVEEMEPDVEREGLARSTLRTDVEVKLRLAGIRVLTMIESALAPGSPYLYLRVTTERLRELGPFHAFEALLEFRQQVTLERKSTIALYVPTWRTSWVGAVGTKKLDWVRERVRDQVDEFINDYLATNPKR